MPPISFRDLLQYAAWALEVFSHFMKTPPPPSTGGSSAPSTAAPPTPAPKPPPEPPEHHVVRNGLIVTLLGCTILLSCCVLGSCIFGGWIVNTVKERTQPVQTTGQGETGGQTQTAPPANESAQPSSQPQATPTPAPTPTQSPTDILRKWGYDVSLGDGCQVSPPINNVVTVVKKSTGFYLYCEVVYRGGPRLVETQSEAGQGLLPPDGQRYSITRAIFRAP